MQQESLDLDAPEGKNPKRVSAEILEAERLDDLETCMVGVGGCESDSYGKDRIVFVKNQRKLS